MPLPDAIQVPSRITITGDPKVVDSPKVREWERRVNAYLASPAGQADLEKDLGAAVARLLTKFDEVTNG